MKKLSIDKLDSQMVTQAEKDSDNFAWYKHQADKFQKFTPSTKSVFDSDYDSTNRARILNYHLVNNKIDIRDFKYVVKSFGEDMGDLPADFVNRDILSGKIKYLLGLELKKRFSWKVLAINKEATTRKEQVKMGMVMDYVYEQIMMPIKKETALKYEQETQGRELSKEETDALNEKIQQEIKAKTPAEIMTYMEREHQDPAEVLASQLLNYIKIHVDLERKFNQGWYHAVVGAEELYHIEEHNGNVELVVCNPLRADHPNSEDSNFTEQEDYVVYEYRMTYNELIKSFKFEEDEVARIYENFKKGGVASQDYIFNWDSGGGNSESYVTVIHSEWMGLKKVGFLTYKDLETGEIKEMPVGEDYIVMSNAGDMGVEWEWISEAHQVYKICLPDPIYKEMGPVPGQFEDSDNYTNTSLNYVGGRYDNVNSEPTSFVDRAKGLCYLFNIIMYRIELLLASDKGKILLMNMNLIPETKGVDLAKWLYYTEANHLGLFDPNEEGNKNKNIDATTAAKVLDMSLVSDITAYIKLGEYVQNQLGAVLGIPKEAEAQVSPYQAVGSFQQTIVQSNNILEPYFARHNNIKRNVIKKLLEFGTYVYRNNNKEVLNYVLDDMSSAMLKMDYELLEMSTYGLYVSDNPNEDRIKETVENLAHAAMQNQKADFKDIIKVLRSDTLQEADEHLSVADKRKSEEANAAFKAQEEEKRIANQELHKQTMEQKQFERETKLLEIEKKGEYELQKQAMLSVGFNEDKDADKDGQLDVIEIYKAGQKVKLDNIKLILDAKKLEETQRSNKKREELQEKAINKSNTVKK